MATRLKPIAHDERLSIVEHLDELRTRILICLTVFSIAFGVCLWQDDAILRVVNDPLADTANAKPCDETRDPLEEANCQQQAQKRVNERIAATAATPRCARRPRSSRRRPRRPPPARRRARPSGR